MIVLYRYEDNIQTVADEIRKGLWFSGTPEEALKEVNESHLLELAPTLVKVTIEEVPAL